jgi:hypothetical protein
MPRPFDEDPKEPREQKVKLKQVSSQQSMFDNAPKKTTPQEFQQQVHAQQEKSNSYKVRASKLAMDFGRLMTDKTLPPNKSLFAQEAERETLSNMIQLAIEINNDSNEQEGMGSLGWITLLFRTCMVQRDLINQAEYKLEQLEKKIDSKVLTDFIIKEVNATLDKKKNSG